MTRRFGANEPDTDPADWRDWRTGLPVAPGLEATERILVVAAHPDDETLGAGGLLAQAHQRGVEITVVIATDGEASHPLSPTHSPNVLAALRRREVYAAFASLAPSAEIVLLGLPDSRLAEQQAELTERLAKLCAGRTLIVTPWGRDAHPDHEACAQAVQDVLAGSQDAARPRLWQYPIWAWQWAVPDAEVLRDVQFHRLPLNDAERAAKEKAAACYRSQAAPLSPQAGDEAVLTPTMLGHFIGVDEVFADVPVDLTDEPAFFDAMYRANPDPWQLRERYYEQRKRSVLLASLPRPTFRRAFEPGCATGLLTADLAGRCSEILAWDVAEAAVAQARARTSVHPGVRVSVGHIPAQWPAGTFDLVVLSEIGYYCRDLTSLVEQLEMSLDPDGVLVACHWRHPAAAHLHTAQEVHDALGRGRQVVVDHVEEDFFLNVWCRTQRSVARAEGIIR